LALAETARDIYAELGANIPKEGLAQAYSAIGYNLNQLKRMDEAAGAMSKAVELLRENKSPVALELACTLGEWWFASKEYQKAIECMSECVQEHLVDSNELGAANDFHLIGCSHRELKEFDKALLAFQEARALFKSAKEVIHVARCDQKIAHCLIELGDALGALAAAQKAIDVFTTAHDQRRETFALFEYGKAQVLNGETEDGLASLEKVLDVVADSEPKDFEFIVEIERRIATILRTLQRDEEAQEIERRVSSVEEVIAE
jgi:tetratricopeptide (TPR) repeat protein